MMTKDLTLQDFESFVIERIFESVEFQHDYNEYLEELTENKFAWDNLFKFRERRYNLNNMYCANLIFGLQIEKTELHHYSLITLAQMFKEFVELKKLEDVKRIDVYSNYNSTDEYAFDFDFIIWIEDL